MREKVSNEVQIIKNLESAFERYRSYNEGKRYPAKLRQMPIHFRISRLAATAFSISASTMRPTISLSP